MRSTCGRGGIRAMVMRSPCGRGGIRAMVIGSPCGPGGIRAVVMRSTCGRGEVRAVVMRSTCAPKGNTCGGHAFNVRPEGATSSQPRASERSERHPGFGQDANDTPPEGAKAATGAFKSANADVQIRQCGRLNRQCGRLNPPMRTVKSPMRTVKSPMRMVKSAAAGIQFHRRGHSNPQ